ncbi:4-(cytidine 5'-diphospho)-2-C-methyl-D-erythritol kinase [Microbaculum marinum]|uniref:4-diphosphocytidyl-2-C-methyl-D-erythritol kinase n=1 Tax=Microbaculum marinum TaxID=1764581 RepID=A0AAW9RQP7_9HYPH
MISEFAAAKINLALAVTGRRSDGYHLLDTLVTFADAGDRFDVRSAPDLSLEVTGPFAADLQDDASNLALLAAERLRAAAFGEDVAAPGAVLILEKALPVASGIGGGSADAAAALRALNRLWGLDWPLERLASLGLRLGADIPMCLHGRPLRARGIGEDIGLLKGFPRLDLVLVNPGVAVSTATVFGALAGRFSPPLPVAAGLRGLDAAITWLGAASNDLQAPAIAAAPVIGEALAALRQTDDCRLARMSGSGATCFGIYADAESARAAAASISAARQGWWVRSVATGPSGSQPT